MAETFLKLFAGCFLLLLLTSCHVFDRRRGPCSIWPMPPPAGGTPVTQKFTSPEGRFRIGLPGANAQALDSPEVSEKFLKQMRDRFRTEEPALQTRLGRGSA